MASDLAVTLSPRRQLGSPTKMKGLLPKEVQAKLELESISGHTVASPRQVDTCASNGKALYAAGSTAVVYDILEGRQVLFLSAQNTRAFVRRGSAAIAGTHSPASAVHSPTKKGPNTPVRSTTTSSGPVRPKVITCVAISRGGDCYAFGEAGHQPRVYVFDSRGEITHVISGHDFGVQAIAFSPDGQYLATLGFREDGYLHTWRLDHSSATKCQSNRLISATNFLLWLHQNMLISGGVRYIRVWDIHHTERADEEVTPLESRNLILGDWLDNEFVCAQPFGPGILVLARNDLLLKCEALKSRDPQVTSTNQPVIQAESDSLGEARCLMIEKDAVLLGGTFGLVTGKSTPDNQQIQWDAESSLQHFRSSGLAGTPASHLIFTEKNSIYVGNDQGNSVTLLQEEWRDSLQCRRIATIPHAAEGLVHNGKTITCTTQLGTLVLNGYDDGSIRWSSDDGIMVSLDCCSSSLSLLVSIGNENEGTVAAVAKDRTTRMIRCHHKSLSILQLLKGHTSSVLAMAFACDGKYFLTCGADHKAMIYTLTIDPQDNLPFYETRDHLTFQTSLTSISIEEDLCYIAADKEIAIIDVATARKKPGIPVHHLQSQTCSISKVAAHKGIVVALTSDRHVQVYASHTKSLLHEVVVNCDSPSTLTIDGNQITTGSSDGIAMHWKLVMDGDFPLVKVRPGTRIPSLSRSTSSPALRELITVRNSPTKSKIPFEGTRPREPLGRSSLHNTQISRRENSQNTLAQALALPITPTKITSRKTVTDISEADPTKQTNAGKSAQVVKVVNMAQAIKMQIDLLVSELESLNPASRSDPQIARALDTLNDSIQTLSRLGSRVDPF